jgi:signal transduction histidine kinase/DNA-binding response OmpR family regulator
VHRSIARKNLLVLVFSFLPFMVGLGYSVHTSADRMYLSVAINVAGSQRMRTMLLANYAQQFHRRQCAGLDASVERAVLETELAVYKRFFDSLKSGDASASVKANPFADILERLHGMDGAVGAYVANVGALLEDPCREGTVGGITSSAMFLKDEFHDVTERYQAANDAMIARQRGIDLSMIAFAAAITVSGLVLTKKIRLQEEGLIRATEEARAAVVARSEFIANMSHEIRTPLNGAIGFGELLARTPLDPVQAQYAQNAMACGRALLGIVNDVLDFSKIESGQLELERVGTDVVELAEDCMDVVRHAAEAKGLELLVDIDPGVPRLATVDPMRLRQVLANLLGNAVKFTERGEIELRLRCVPLPDGRGRLLFSVRDTGIGIAPDRRERLFKPFSQADASTTRKYGGTGLGLVISQRIVSQMGGTIDLESGLGQGSTFSFAIETDVEPGAARDLEPLRRLGRCLVADGNARSRDVLAGRLRSWNLDCETCADGASVLDALAGGVPFGVVLCDARLPGLDGPDLARAIRDEEARGAARRAVVVLHAVCDAAGLHERCRGLAVDALLPKPAKEDALFECMRTIAVGGGSKAESPSAQNDVIGQKLRILVADDNKLNLHLTVSMIQMFAPKSVVDAVEDGRSAVDRCDQARYDLVLMDLQMPVLGGLEATRRIREGEAAAETHVPIFALTAGAVMGEERTCREAGMDGYLAKPLHPDALRRVLREVAEGLGA